MPDDVGGLAWSIARVIQDEANLHTGIEPIVASEAARLCSLDFSLTSYRGVEGANGLRFQQISFGGVRARVNKDEVIEFTEVLLDAENLPGLRNRVASLSSFQFGELIAQLHSIGSHYPRGKTGISISKRDLGAFYTPMPVSDFITELTLGPILDLICDDTGKHNDAAREHLFSFRILDPSCGPGVFLLSAARAVVKRLRRVSDSKSVSGDGVRVSRMLYGVDVDSAALEVAAVSISVMCSEPVSFSHSNLRQGNSLVSLNGWDGISDHRGFFENPERMMAFEWKREFPEILNVEDDGFDFVLMNPPYDRLKPNLAEFLRERLLSGSREVHILEFERHKQEMREAVDYFRKSGDFSLGNLHTINMYRLFIEQGLRLLKSGGRFGFVVPSTLLGDVSATKLREHLLLNNEIHHMSEYSEGARVFPGVTQSVCIAVMEKGGTTKTFNAAFGLEEFGEIPRSRYVKLKPSDIRTTIGSTMAIPRVDRQGWRIMRRIHSFPSLESIPWVENRRGELDLTLDRSYIRNEPVGPRLLRGANIGRYTTRDHPRLGSEFVDLEPFLSARAASRRLKHRNLSRIACQQVSNKAQRWRLKFAPIDEGIVLANSCNYIVLDSSVDDNLLYYLLGVMNSELLNWRFDTSNSNNHVSNTELSSLPIANPFDDNGRLGELAVDMIAEVQRVLKSPVEFPPLVEAVVFKLYGCSPSDIRHVLKSRGSSELELDAVLQQVA